eukprot:9476849-Pyramimonas_sp.AAC.1
MMRHISQARQRAAPPAWVVQMMNMEAQPNGDDENPEEEDEEFYDGSSDDDGNDDGDPEGGAAAADGVQPATEYVYGWDADGCKAFRAPLAEPNKKEYTDDVEVSSSDPKGFIIAKFSEEDVKEI